MSFSIVNNIPAISTQRQLGIVNQGIAKSIRRLSSGLRINSAADDAAGLAISERLRSQISALQQGGINAQDTISVVQTAEGGLDTATEILRRMKTLGATAASAAKSDGDRALIQVEVNELVDELSRIADTTSFAGQKLLNGDVAGAENGIASTVKIDSNSFIGPQATALVANVVIENAQSNFSLANQTFELKVVAGGLPGYFSVQLFSSLSTAAEINAGAPLAQTSFGGALTGAIVSLAVPVLTSAGGSFAVLINNAGMSFSADQVGKIAFVSSTAAQLTSTTDKSLLIQVGAQTGEVVRVFAPTVRPGDLFFGQSVRVDTMLQAEGALNQVDQALNRLNKSRSILGALQNRFENVIRNNDIYRENLTASESRIRDLNVAAETTNFTKNQILLQSATAFLAQANLLPQSILQLLR